MSFDNLKLDIVDAAQVVLSATLSRLYCVLGNFQVHWHFGAKLFTSFLISTLVPLALNLPMKYTYGAVEGVKQSLPLQLGFEWFQYIRLN